MYDSLMKTHTHTQTQNDLYHTKNARTVVETSTNTFSYALLTHND